MIILFSGTGNTRRCAHELSALLGHEIVELRAPSLLVPEKTRLDLPPGESVVWMSPIHSWGLPPLVLRFLKGVQLKGCGERTPHYLICTCGDDIGQAHLQWEKAVGRRGWTPAGAMSVQMPNTYICMDGFDLDSPEVARQKLEAMPRRIALAAERIHTGWRGTDVVQGKSAWAKTHLVYPMFVRFCMSPRAFKVSDACVGCGVCASNCPTANITIADGHPHWGSRCTLCLACLHGCPHRAIDYGDITRSRGRYSLPRLLSGQERGQGLGVDGGEGTQSVGGVGGLREGEKVGE